MREGVAEIAFDRVASSRLNFTTEATRWHLVIDSGRVMRFDVGHVDDPDAELQWSQADATAIISRVHRGDDALRRTQQSDDRAGRARTRRSASSLFAPRAVLSTSLGF
jgi:hypothetical protein